MIEVGQTVGNYRVVATIGQGGMGAVFLAEHPVIRRKAALKVIHPEHARNATVVARFVNEATAISRIGHEHIVEVTDLGRTPEGDFYLVMEYLEGRTLAELVAREGRLSPARALAIAAQIADALAASHASGVVHRDVKPDNVFLVARRGDPCFVKVLDFGLAKLMTDDGEDGSGHLDPRPGLVLGTPFYMSPEQCRGEREIDHRADVYGLGVVLFEMLTGQVPFGGEAFDEILLKQVSMRAPSARDLVPELPQALDALLQRALAKNPDERFQTMTAFRDALLPRAEATGARRHERFARRRGGRAVAFAVGAALCGAALGATLTRRDALRATARADEPTETDDESPHRHHARPVEPAHGTVGGVLPTSFLR